MAGQSALYRFSRVGNTDQLGLVNLGLEAKQRGLLNVNDGF